MKDSNEKKKKTLFFPLQFIAVNKFTVAPRTLEIRRCGCICSSSIHSGSGDLDSGIVAALMKTDKFVSD